MADHLSSDCSERFDVVVIGAGYTGLAAAYDLASSGFHVALLEGDADVGGLAGTFEFEGGVRVEKFYHHWFSSDRDVLGFLEELGLGERIVYCSSNTGLFHANSIFRLAGPLDLLRFTPLPFIDRIRTGLMTLAARRVREWRSLENTSAADWIIKHAGRRSYDVIWEPLLKGKFGAEASNISAVWFWNKLKLRGSSRDARGAEQLAYFKGGFGAATRGIADALKAVGVRIYTSTEVNKITTSSGCVSGVVTDKGDRFLARAVLATVPLPVFLDLAPDLPEEFAEQARKIRFLGNVCMVFELDRSLSSTYWLNVADPSFPFVGVIEHTNLDSPTNYLGRHIAYLSKYLPVGDEMFKMSDDDLLQFCLPHLKRIFPQFSREWIIRHKVWKARHSQPVVTKGYSDLIPAERTPIENLWLCTMAQIYPEDRGTNYAVRRGRAVAQCMANVLR